ncbi:uncharacterized protein RSE6_11569 [Rhynchosporium secalis]|uniref:Uncharacterized protein n=1 Tax=Rhynchosporium secalis TaxID=38038 RepID=A0A1E1MNA6_RHYSE|nr:uncharacterized protein RSE6_11569 [Rhynchosporium secalis]
MLGLSAIMRPPSLAKFLGPDTSQTTIKVFRTFEKCQLNQNTVISCTLRHVDLTGCNISCNLDHCRLSDCTVTTCDLVNTTFHDSESTESWLEDCEIITCPLALRRFSPDLRALIFERCIDFTKKKTPVILVALRGDPELYQEGAKSVRLREDVLESCSRDAEVEVVVNSFHRPSPPPLDIFPNIFGKCIKLTHVSMTVFDRTELLRWMGYVVNTFPNLQSLLVSIPVKYYLGIERRSVELKECIDGLNLRSQVKAVRYRVTSSAWEPWIWEVPRDITTMADSTLPTNPPTVSNDAVPKAHLVIERRQSISNT